MSLLDRYSTDLICFLLDAIEGKDLNQQKEILTQWFVENGGNQSETEELIYRQSEFADALAQYRKNLSVAWDEKLKADQKRKESLQSKGLWDDQRNCEIPVPNTPDPYDQRFGGNGTLPTRSLDVDWRSNS